MAYYIETIVHVRLCQVALKARIDATEERAIVEQLNKQLSENCASTCAARSILTANFAPKQPRMRTPASSGSNQFSPCRTSPSATSAAGRALARLLRPHLAPATWADDALDLFASVWRYELAAAVALLGALRRILINYVRFRTLRRSRAASGQP